MISAYELLLVVFICLASPIRDTSTTIITDLQNIQTESDISGWSFSNWQGGSMHIQNCAGTNVMGGYGLFGPSTCMTKTYLTKVPHQAIKFVANLQQIDSWDTLDTAWQNDNSRIFLDGSLRQEETPSNAKIQSGKMTNIVGAGNKCGSVSFWDYTKNIEIYFSHSSSTLEVKVTSTIDQDSFDESLGIGDITITTYNCYPGCSQCTGNADNQCTACEQGYGQKNGECKQIETGNGGLDIMTTQVSNLKLKSEFSYDSNTNKQTIKIIEAPASPPTIITIERLFYVQNDVSKVNQFFPTQQNSPNIILEFDYSQFINWACKKTDYTSQSSYLCYMFLEYVQLKAVYFRYELYVTARIAEVVSTFCDIKIYPIVQTDKGCLVQPECSIFTVQNKFSVCFAEDCAVMNDYLNFLYKVGDYLIGKINTDAQNKLIPTYIGLEDNGYRYDLTSQYNTFKIEKGGTICKIRLAYPSKNAKIIIKSNIELWKERQLRQGGKRTVEETAKEALHYIPFDIVIENNKLSLAWILVIAIGSLLVLGATSIIVWRIIVCRNQKRRELQAIQNKEKNDNQKNQVT